MLGERLAVLPLCSLVPDAPHAQFEQADIAVIGAGAAGLMAAIFAGRAARAAAIASSQSGQPPLRNLRIIAFDGARTLGAKVLVAGGGRCNVTHHHVDESAYAGSSRHAIKKVLRAFPVESTVEFFRELGVELKREDTGKLFPVTDSARSVLDALLRAAHDVGVELRHPWRVERIERVEEGGEFGFVIHASGDAPPIRARAVILATGGKSLPKSGSDGHGYEIAKSLGHTLTPRVFPALVPLVLDVNKTFLHTLSGITIDAELTVWSSSGKRVQSFHNSLLFTHFGLSGPAALDISRYFTQARLDAAAGAESERVVGTNTNTAARLTLNLLPGESFESLDKRFAPDAPGAKLSVLRRLTEAEGSSPPLPDRLARALLESLSITPSTPVAQLSRDARRTLVHHLLALPLPVVGDRGYTYAEVTAGGVPLSELHLDTMASRHTPGLYLCGEICDVDGRIGGFNFQWAWASGSVAGAAAVRALIGRSA